MYCKNCRKETSDAASFCPYCGAKTTVTTPETKKETVNQVSVESNGNESEELPVYKRKNKVAILVGFIPLIYAIIHGLIWAYSLVAMGGK
ncbi:MAG: zinc-ribbon domain-containing protein [Lachnospiraceae bacterium]